MPPGPPLRRRFGWAAGASLEQQQHWQRGSFVELALLPLLPHAAWAVAYYTKARTRLG
jgi:hypothetical protein